MSQRIKRITFFGKTQEKSKDRQPKIIKTSPRISQKFTCWKKKVRVLCHCKGASMLGRPRLEWLRFRPNIIGPQHKISDWFIT